MKGTRGRKYERERDQDRRFKSAHWVGNSLVFMLVRTVSYLSRLRCPILFESEM
jgi:hypothetical protein